MERIGVQRLIVVLVLGLTATAALAAPITTPPGLNVGDSYRLAFITSTVTTGQSGNIADYNTLATNAANSQPELAALGTTWAAIASTSAVDARDNSNTNPNVGVGVPIYRLDGLRIADNNADLWDSSIQNALSINQLGNTISTLPWTGTLANGTKGPGGFSGPLGADPALAGSSSLTTQSWIIAGGYNTSPPNPNPIYAISDILTVAAPPSVGVPAPTISHWGLIALTVLLSALGISLLRRPRSLAS